MRGAKCQEAYDDKEACVYSRIVLELLGQVLFLPYSSADSISKDMSIYDSFMCIFSDAGVGGALVGRMGSRVFRKFRAE